MKNSSPERPESSNRDEDWGKLYDYYEVEMREVYRTVSKPQNDSHFLLLKNLALKYLSENAVFCEIGFSAGITLRYAAGLFTEVYGLDISARNVEFTREELDREGYQNIRLFQLDLMNRNKRFHEKFNILSLIHGLEHFSDNDYPVIFENIRYYLKEGGLFTGALPYKGRFNYRMCPKCHHVFEVDGHVSSHDKASLTSLFRKHNFDILYLGNFNRYYNRRQKNFVRRSYRYLRHGVLGIESNDQLEFIVKPGRIYKKQIS